MIPAPQIDSYKRTGAYADTGNPLPASSARPGEWHQLDRTPSGECTRYWGSVPASAGTLARLGVGRRWTWAVQLRWARYLPELLRSCSLLDRELLRARIARKAAPLYPWRSLKVIQGPMAWCSGFSRWRTGLQRPVRVREAAPKSR